MSAKLSTVTVRALGILTLGHDWALIHDAGEITEAVAERRRCQPAPRRAWVYTDTPQAYDYPPTLRVPVRTLDRMIREGLVERRYHGGGDVPLTQWGITKMGRQRWEEARQPPDAHTGPATGAAAKAAIERHWAGDKRIEADRVG